MKIEFRLSDWEQNRDLRQEYLSSLVYRMDSYLEDQMEQCEVYMINADKVRFGIAAKRKDELYVFYLPKSHLGAGPDLFAQFIEEFAVRAVTFQTHDSLLAGLVADWEYQKEKEAYLFADGGKGETPPPAFPLSAFSAADGNDAALIAAKTGDFFDRLPERIARGEIYKLLSDGELLGCGIIEPSRYYGDVASIGMITCREHRGKGVGQSILRQLKEVCYAQGLTPVAGCWYYNTLSRKTLRRAGMYPVSRLLRAILTGREKVPERTGNPPGEEVADR